MGAYFSALRSGKSHRYDIKSGVYHKGFAHPDPKYDRLRHLLTEGLLFQIIQLINVYKGEKNMLNEKLLFHLGFDPKKYRADFAIMPGDPGRVEKIAKYLDNTELVAFNREYKTVLGEIAGKRVFVTSTGIGGPSAAIAVEELALAGVKTFIRVGTCGAISPAVGGGDVVVATSAVRQEGTALHYAPPEYPATADFSVTVALNEAAEKSGAKTFCGVVQSKDSFYGQHSPESSPVSGELMSKWEAWKRLGVLASEMECATLFTVAASKGLKSGAVLSVFWNQEKEETGEEKTDTDTAIKIAIEAVKNLKE